MPQRAPAEVPRANARAHASATGTGPAAGAVFFPCLPMGPFGHAKNREKWKHKNEMSPRNKSDSWEKICL
jgi:hypothetical protein